MISLRVMPVLAVVLGALTAGAAPVKFGFEGRPSFVVDDDSGQVVAQLTPYCKMARGSFGSALAVGDKGAWMDIPEIPGASATSCATIFLRFRKTGDPKEKNACILASDEWGRSGGVLLYLQGSGLSFRLRDGAAKDEKGFQVYKELPTDKWCSVAIVFDKPKVVVYADGRRVCEGNWPHPLRLGSTCLGAWHGSSFRGFIDDFTYWPTALAAAEIKRLSNDARYEDVEGYQDDGTGGIRKTEILPIGGRVVATLDGARSVLVLDDLGYVTSLKEKVSGRELVGDAVPFVTAKFGRDVVVPRGLEVRGGNRYAFVFAKPKGEVVLDAGTFDGGWIFSVAACSPEGISELEFARIDAGGCRKWVGGYANAWSDDDSAVCVRSADIKAVPFAMPVLGVRVDAKEFPPVGRKALVVAGPRGGFREQLKAMTLASGAPHSNSGGAWSMDSEVARWSYVFAPILDGDVDYWIEFAKRSGFTLIHFASGWETCLGEYEVNRLAFPGGIDEMAKACEKIHQADLKCGIHTLTGCISLSSKKWVTPVCDSNLVYDAFYTLSRHLDEDADELQVEEVPADCHSTVLTYMSNGNILFYNGELMQYSGIRREKPYAFTGLRRGAFGTRSVGRIPAGATIGYVHQRYRAVFPAPDGPLAGKLADRLARVYATCNLDELYFDGSEGMGKRYAIDAMRHCIFTGLRPSGGVGPSIEASCQGANNWWFQTRLGTTDHAVYGVRAFHDWHIARGETMARKSNFLEPQMGWWQPRQDCPYARGHMLDEMEYFAGKNAGVDAPMSIQGVGMRPLPVGVRRQMAVLGWYEHARMARALTPEVRGYLSGAGNEGRLRQCEDGVWRFTRTTYNVHRVGLDSERKWQVESPWDCKAALRVEALYRPKESVDGKTLAGAKEFEAMKLRQATGVSAKMSVKDGTEHGDVLCLKARNENAERKASWAVAECAFAFPGKDVDRSSYAYRAWVKGDGSGALLNIVFAAQPEFTGGTSEHFVRLNFKGWKLVPLMLRERDAARHRDYVWPYEEVYSIYRQEMRGDHVSGIAVYLNDLAQGASAEVEVGEIRAYPQEAVAWKQITIRANGGLLKLPFELESGEYAELEAGVWSKYSAKGERLFCRKGTDEVRLKKGTNCLELDSPETARVEVSVFGLWQESDAFVAALTDEMKRHLRYEAMMPFEWNPPCGLIAPSTVPVRPGEVAHMSFEILGPCANPKFVFSSFWGLSRKESAIDAVAGDDEMFVCRNGIDWTLVKAKDGRLVKEGRLSNPLPVLDGSADFEFSADLPKTGMPSPVVDILKDYR